MATGTFATAINCMDGRTQLPVMEFLKSKFSVDFVDTITEPGPIKILAENDDDITVESIKKRIEISVYKHGSKAIALVGHHDCAGNPVDREIQEEQLKQSAETIKSWDFGAEVVCLFVNDKWAVEELS